MSGSGGQVGRRLMKDSLRAKEELMVKSGIWYWFNENNFKLGEALIKGPPSTPYEGCLLHFSFVFPDDYPFSPPKVTFLTCDSYTRFHPNLYTEGKVCLSILGTYTGPGWSGTQSLSTVLLSIIALLDDNPLSHEPAFEKGTLMEEKHRSYADAVEYNMVKLMLQTLKTHKNNLEMSPWRHFHEILEDEIPKLEAILKKKVEERASLPERHWSNLTYGMSVKSNWRGLKLSVQEE
jgi:ubiquitin-protein ligase